MDSHQIVLRASFWFTRCSVSYCLPIALYDLGDRSLGGVSMCAMICINDGGHMYSGHDNHHTLPTSLR